MIYGNVTNIGNTHFQFDKIYSTRYAMENDTSVFIAAGRYVLVSYYSDDSQTPEYWAAIDAEQYDQTSLWDDLGGFDATVWQRWVTSDGSGYSYVCHLTSTAPRLMANDVYFNEAGFDPEQNNYDEENLPDTIEVIGNRATNSYELNMNLPSVGNTGATAYNLIYGPGDASTGVRTRDTQWYPGDEPTLIENGAPALGGKTFDLGSIAGTLNTMHNRLGQIIVQLPSAVTEEGIAALSRDYIYKLNNTYYRRGVTYTKTVVPESDYTYTAVQNMTATDFKLNKYYISPSAGVYEAASEYNANETYYLKNINAIRYTPIVLTEYEPDTFYVKDGNNYLCDHTLDHPADSSRQYYNISVDDTFTFKEQYSTSGTFFTKDADGSYNVCLDDAPAANQTYYSRRTISSQTEAYYYYPGVYYRLAEGSTTQYVLATEEEATLYTEYYKIVFDMSNPIYAIDASTGTVFLSYPELSRQGVGQLYNKNIKDGMVYEYTDENNNVSYKSVSTLANEDWADGVSPYAVARKYYTVEDFDADDDTQTTKQLSFTRYYTEDLFLPGVYYTYDEESYDYMLAYQWSGLRATEYCTILAAAVAHPFYLQARYYYAAVGEQDVYYLDENISPSMNVATDYYSKTRLFVQYDETGQCPYGYEWSDDCAYIPPSITLYSRVEHAGLIPMMGINNGENSINGTLLKLNELCYFDEENRDKNTLSGAINIVKDILYQLRSFKPGRMLYINDFGQITASDITYEQLKNLIQ